MYEIKEINMLERKMASIQQVLEVKPHFNADRLDIVTVLGWKCVVNKGQFKEGDLCVYFEIDSIIPKIPELMFIEKSSSDMVLRTIRLRGQLSQGLCWTTDILPDNIQVKEGLDVTDILKVGKYEESISDEMIGKSKGFHPTVVPRTGETRVQTEPRLINEFMGKLVAFGIKYDGTSASFINDNGEKHICSHTHSMIEDDNSIYWKMAKKYDIINILNKEGNISIQGEIVGPGVIKGNPLGLKEIDLFIFKIYLNDEQRYLNPLELIDFCDRYGLKHVPMELNVLFTFTMEELIEIANKSTYEESGNPAEGIVVIPMEPCYSEALCGNLSMKVINNEYLLKMKKKK